MHLFTALQDTETLVLRLLQHFSPLWMCYMYWRSSQQKAVCPTEALFHCITQTYETCLHYLFDPCASSVQDLLAMLQITSKNSSMLCYLPSQIPTCQTSHRHRNFPQSMWLFRKTYLKNPGLNLIQSSEYNKKENKYEKHSVKWMKHCMKTQLVLTEMFLTPKRLL